MAQPYFGWASGGPDWAVEYRNTNQGIEHEVNNIRVQYTLSEENDLNSTFPGWIPSVDVLYFSWTQPNLILQFQEHLSAGKAILTFSKRCKKTRQWVFHPQAHEYALVIPTKY